MAWAGWLVLSAVFRKMDWGLILSFWNPHLVKDTASDKTKQNFPKVLGQGRSFLPKFNRILYK